MNVNAIQPRRSMPHSQRHFNKNSDLFSVNASLAIEVFILISLVQEPSTGNNLTQFTNSSVKESTLKVYF